MAFFRNYKRAFLRVGRPIDLATFVAERSGEPDALVARKARGTIHHHLARELRAAVGPPLRTPTRVEEKVMRDRHLREVLEHVSRQKGRSAGSVRREAVRDLREIASRYSPLFIDFIRPIFRWIFQTMYDRVEIDEKGLAEVRRLAADRPLVLTPSHKSHVDYMLLSWAFYEHGLIPPQVAAGINLSFWPFGSFARRAGAFFIRRSFKGDKIYSATLRAYVKYLLRERFTQEFFPEGGRSRTGKLLFPKTGLFSMEVDAWGDGAADDVLFVPIAVDYERLVEGASYAQELAGGEKKKESFGALLQTPRALLRRYGRIYLQFGTPVSLKDVAEKQLGASAGAPSLTMDVDERGSDSRRSLVQHLANRVMGHRRGGDGHAGQPGGRGAPLPRAARNLGGRRGRAGRAAPVHRDGGERPDRHRPRGRAVEPDRPRPHPRRGGDLRRQQGHRGPGGGRAGHLPGPRRQADLPGLPPQRHPEPLRRALARRTVGAVARRRRGARRGAGRRPLALRLFRLEFMYPVGATFDSVFRPGSMPSWAWARSSSRPG